MNKKKGLAICSILSCTIVGAAVFASLSSNFVKAQADDVVYKLNTVNFDGVYNEGASGNKFNGVDVYKFGLVGGQYGVGTAAGLFNSVINVALLIIANFTSKKLSGNSMW